MKIRIDGGGKILAVGQDNEIMGSNTFSVESVPVDFINTFSMGKYVAPDGNIEEVPGWVAPEILEGNS